MSKIDVSQFRAVVGAHKQSEPGPNYKSIEVSQIIVHEGWNPTNINNDIAVVKLSQPIGLDSGNLNAICLGTSADNLEGQVC